MCINNFVRAILVLILSIFILTSVLSIANGADKVIVKRIVDGDTIEVVTDKSSILKVRVLYIDTPEKFHTAKLKKTAVACGVGENEIAKLGIMSTEYAVKYFDNTTSIFVTTKGIGFYGRYLSEIYSADVSVDNLSESYNYQIVKDGYACGYTKSKYPKEILNALKYAKENKKGLWGVNYSLMECICKSQ